MQRNARHHRHRPSGPPRRGFTLIELLMVILIISILAALLLAGVRAAVLYATRARVLTELNQLELAISNYQRNFGALPPGMGSTIEQGNPSDVQYGTARYPQLEMHLRKAFPRYAFAKANLWDPSGNNVQWRARVLPTSTRNLNFKFLDPAESYLFCLNGTAIYENGKPIGFDGFSADPARPHQLITAQKQRLPRLFEFDPRRLTDFDGDGFPEYSCSDNSRLPIVYFEGGKYVYVTGTSANSAQYFSALYPIPGLAAPTNHSTLVTQFGLCMPYAQRTPSAASGQLSPLTDREAWHKASAFQLVACGFDQRYGEVPTNRRDVFKIFPPVRYSTGGTTTKSDADNLVNFHGSNLGSAQ